MNLPRDIFEVIRQRRTTNGYFLDRPLSDEHIKMMLEAASFAPSHFNSQPWRFVLIRDEKRRKELGRIAGQSMRVVMEKGDFWRRYLRYFRFSKEEIEKTGDGIYIDNMPAPLRPFIRYLFSEKGSEMMNKLRVPWILAIDSKKLVSSSPLILGVLLSKDEYKPEEKSGMYCLLALGMAIENIWLAATALGIGVQFISLPMEAGGEYWQKCIEMVAPPPDYELIALFRLGYINPDAKRPVIDWTSTQRKDVSQFCFAETFGHPWHPKLDSVAPLAEHASGRESLQAATDKSAGDKATLTE
ncbi:MAG: nitroreductase family protein [Chloroherpetonaceae bacterium]|nr:nitroreductase family protein [Chloroherpetonaceae bacterium]MCS7212570.1 nitroreductase family protein [Chloroherpetonaceae bacterium]MDW8018880.1 nitroreductase family protein [Chloroherpetonaceae bacterium]